MDNLTSSKTSSLPLASRKHLKFIINLKIISFLIFVITPLIIFQEFFIIVYSNSSAPLLTIDSFIFFITQYSKERHLFVTYIGFIIVVYTLLSIHFRSVTRYIIKEDHLEQAQKTINNHILIMVVFIAASMISSIIPLILDFDYILSLPGSVLIMYPILRILWAGIVAILFIYYYLHIINPVRETMNLYSFSTKHYSLYNRFKSILICILLLGVFLLVFAHLVILLQNAYANQSPLSQINLIFNWGIQFFSFCLSIVVIILYIQNKIDYLIKVRIHRDVQDLVNSGNLSAQSIYYEQNDLGLLISEYNNFISVLKEDIFKIQQNTNVLTKENISLRTQTSDLIQEMSNQEIYVTQMNIATNATSTTIQRLSLEVNGQYNILIKEQENIKKLIIDTNNIIDIFNNIIEEHSQSKISSESALFTVDKYLEQSTLTSTHFTNINEKINHAGQETESINEVLKIIKNISEQTNLLSMSAAIEAAHGGHSGQGFAMVAGEIRKLANMSQESVDKISQRLSSITELIAESKKISSTILEVSETTLKSSKELKNSIQQVREISDQLSQVSEEANTITKSQSDSIDKSQEITRTMTDFLDTIYQKLQTENSTSVTMSLNFRTIVQNFRQVRASLYRMETSLERLSIVERHLGYILEDFSVDNHPYTYKELTESTSSEQKSIEADNDIILSDIKKNEMSNGHE